MQLAQMALKNRYQKPQQTTAMQEYEYAKKNGFQGSFMDFKNAGGGASGGGEKWGMTGQTVQGPDGRFYTIQYSNYGNRRITPLTLEEAQAQAQGEPSLGDGWASMREGGQPPQQQRQPINLTPSRGVSEVDTGTGTLLVDKATGQPISQVSKDIAGAEGQKIEGKAMAEGKLALPKQRRALEMYEAKQQHMDQFFDKALALASETGTTGFVGGLSQAIPGSPAYRLKQHLAPIKAAIGFEELQNMRDNSPTGGALGQVSEMELTLLNSALGSLDVAQSSEDVIAVINSIRSIRTRFAEMKRQAYEEDVARFGGENVPNPSTGKISGTQPKREFRIIGVE